ncbi:serine hydrolase domain-containing protein [Flavobacterium sp. UBA7663]|jgi:CubicO group peptidase (beta-lactamase class C family)|uniref:serine hydrolase domain-containing protein n=1 Tax=Flavobacterium sp. UBA7663 TaxID=1946557 RepID=UPI0025C5B64B|nr:serine hydrolase domain-containing protein [Flavobacterium sp. UBA7663]
MKKIIIFLFSLLLYSCTKKEKTHSSEFLLAQKELTEQLTKISTQTDFNGFGVAISNENEVLYQNGFGIANLEPKQKYDENTVQNIASVSKTFIGIAILKAQELGKLQLDDPINKYLSFKVTNPYYPNIPITIRQLTTHTSSINDNEVYMKKTIVLNDTINLKQNLDIDISPTKFNPPKAKITIEEFLKNTLDNRGKWYLKDVFLNKKPGKIYNYSNVGATLAALVLEKATGISYDKFTTEHILKPLQMNSSGWSFDSVNFSKCTNTFQDKRTPYPFYSLNTYPDGGMLTTSKDMGNYISELLKGFLGKGTLLNKESYQEYFRPQLQAKNFIDRDTSEYGDYNIGITMTIFPSGNFGHFGGDPGLFSVIQFDKKKKTARYYIINTNPSGPETNKYHKQINDALDIYTEKLNTLSKLE